MPYCAVQENIQYTPRERGEALYDQKDSTYVNV